jgi:putative hemolysin
MADRTVKSEYTPRRDFALKPFRYVLRSLLAERWNTYVPRVDIFLETEQYVIKTAKNWEEVEPAFSLRHGVFYREVLGQSNLLSLDLENSDVFFDHIVITDKATGRCAGTCRLNIIEPNATAFSSAKFCIDKLRTTLSPSMEIGRLCLHPAFRKTELLALVREIIADYMEAAMCSHLFGFTSLPTMDKETIARACLYLSKHGHLYSDLAVAPQEAYKIPYFQNHVTFVNNLSGNADDIRKDAITPLIMFFLQCGARFFGEPAFDRKMQCADFFFALGKETISKPVDMKVS